MTRFFDSSVLVPVFAADHVHHEASAKVFLAANRRQAFCAAHSLAEVYAVLTRLPLSPRISAEQVLLFLENIQERMRVVALDEQEYLRALQEAASRGIVGGAVYDFLIAFCALKVNAPVIYTWNVNDFQRLGPEVARRLRTP